MVDGFGTLGSETPEAREARLAQERDRDAWLRSEAQNPFGLTEELFERLGYAFCDGWVRRVRDTKRDEEIEKEEG